MGRTVLTTRQAARLDALRETRDLADVQRHRLEDGIRRAINDGCPIIAVADAAGVSRQHIYNLRRQWDQQRPTATRTLRGPEGYSAG